MKNGYAIADICRQVVKVSERMESLTMAMEQIEQGNLGLLLEFYEEQRLDELDNVQKLVMKLTELIVEENAVTNNDSAFMPGELDAVKKDTVDGNPVEPSA